MRVKGGSKEERLEMLVRHMYSGLLAHVKDFGFHPVGHGNQKGVLTGK